MTLIPLPHKIIGSGPHHVMVIHGWFGDHTSFAQMFDYLDGDRFTYVFPDLRGYGRAIDRAGEFTVAEAATDAIDLANSLGWGSFSVIGHSMGGKIAQQVLVTELDRLHALIGISPVPASGAGIADSAWTTFREAATSPSARARIIAHTTGEVLPARWVACSVRRSLEVSSPVAFASYLQDWALNDFHESLPTAGPPMLLVVGRRDPELSAEVMDATLCQWFPDARLHVIESAGHYSMDETPLELASVIEQFLDEH